MPFIRNGSYVEVTPGHRLAGRFGVVREIRIIQETRHIMVFADIFDRESGRMDLLLFGTDELVIRKDAPTVSGVQIQREDYHALVAREII